MKYIGGYLAVVIGLILLTVGVLYFRSGNSTEPPQNPTGTTTTVSDSTTPTTDTDEDSAQQSFRNQPGAITSIEQIGEGEYWSLGVDLLTRNGAWTPGGPSEHGGFFINQNAAVRNLTVTADTAVYRCDGSEVTTRVGTISYIADVADIMSRSKTDQGLLGEFGYTAYFDISDQDITAIYEQCLP